MQTLQVGATYPLPNPSPGQERADLTLTSTGLQLVYFISQPTAADAAAFTTGELFYGIVSPVPGLPVVVLDAVQDDWMLDVPVHLHGEAVKVMPTHAVWELILVDADTHQVVALREIALHTRFRELLQQELAQQATQVGDPATVTEVIAILQRDNTTEDFLIAEGLELFHASR